MFIDAEAIEVYDVECDEIPKRSSAWKGAVAGAAGGLVASWIMNQFQAATSKAAELAQGQNANANAGPQDGEDATIKAASAISENVAAHRLTADEKKIAGPAIHYVFGSAMGALYGVASELAPKSSAGRGVPFGAALCFGADEVAVPMLGLSGAPSETPVSTHASALAAHIVYGFTTDTVRRAVRGALA
jgi:putative membrane protein